MTGLLPVHTPYWQVSVRVHGVPSMHVVPFAFAGFEQSPVAGSHVPTLWHWSRATHTTGLTSVQTPLWQVSVLVHALLSLQAVPFGLFG